MLVLVFHLEAVAVPRACPGRGVGVGRTVSASGAGPAWAAGQERGSRERVWGGMNMAARRGPGLSGLAIAAGNARFVGSWVPVDWHPASRAQGCGPQVRELGLGGAGNHVFCPLCLQSRSRLKWRSQKSLAFEVKGFTALPLCIKLRPVRFSQAA